MSASYDAAFEQAALAEEVGFDIVSVSEHHFTPLTVDPNPALLVGALSRTLSRARDPHPPLYYSAGSLDSAAFAGSQRLGAAISFFAAGAVSMLLERYRSEAAAAGWEPRPGDVICRQFAIVAETQAEAERIRRSFVPRRLLEHPPKLDFEIDPSELGFGAVRFCGTPERVAEQVEEFAATTGVGILDLVFTAGLSTHEETMRSLELFGREVIPCLRLHAPVAAAP